MLKRIILLFNLLALAIYLFTSTKATAKYQKPINDYENFFKYNFSPSSPTIMTDYNYSSPWLDLNNFWNKQLSKTYFDQNFYHGSWIFSPLNQNYYFVPAWDYFYLDYKTLVMKTNYDNKIAPLSYPSSFLLPVQFMVKPKPKIVPISLNLSPEEMAFYHFDQTRQINATLTYTDNNSEVVTTSISFHSEDPNVVTVSGDGLVTAIGAGTTIITANYSHLLATVKVKVFEPILFDIISLDLEPNLITLTDERQTEQLKIWSSYRTISSNISNETWPLLLNRTSFVSSDPTIASVDNYGKVTGLSDGKAIITATQDNVSESVYVIVLREKKAIPVILGLRAPLFLKPNQLAVLECWVKNPEPGEILTYEWFLDGELLPQTGKTTIGWKSPMTSGLYQLCCQVTNNYGEEDMCCQEISVNENNQFAWNLLEEEPYKIRVNEYLILILEDSKIQNSISDNLYFSCNIGTIQYQEGNGYIYSFQTFFPGTYLVQITGYSDSGTAQSLEFILQVLPIWAS